MSQICIAPTPSTYIGWGAIDQLHAAIQTFNATNILVVADPALRQHGITNIVTKPIQAAGLAFDLYTDIIPEPMLSTAQALVNFARKGSYNLVIGLGGGSALDLAKLAAAMVNNEGDVSQYLNLTGSKSLDKKGIPTILIPTTSGTGAEVTNIAVLALATTKDVVSNNLLIADVAIVDPQLTVSVPPKVTASTGADALTHAIEAYISVNSNPYSDGHALQAIKLISSSLALAVADGSNREARTNMAYGSYLAGLAFFNAGVGAIHALAYPLGGQFHIPHGDSNAVLIPYVMKYIRGCCFRKMANIYEAMGGNLSGLSLEEASVKCIIRLRELLKAIGVPSTLQGFHIPASAISQLTNDAVEQKRLLARCPMNLGTNDIKSIYEAAFSGKLF